MCCSRLRQSHPPPQGALRRAFPFFCRAGVWRRCRRTDPAVYDAERDDADAGTGERSRQARNRTTARRRIPVPRRPAGRRSGPGRRGVRRRTPYVARHDRDGRPCSADRENRSPDYRDSASEAKYSATPAGDASIPFLPLSHPAGQTSPCSSWNCNASTMRSISSMLRPSDRSLTT